MLTDSRDTVLIRGAIAPVSVWFARAGMAALTLAVCISLAFASAKTGEADAVAAATAAVSVRGARRGDGRLFTLLVRAEVTRAVGIDFALGAEPALAATSIITTAAVAIRDASASRSRVTRATEACFAILTHAVVVGETSDALRSAHAGIGFTRVGRAVAWKLTGGVNRPAFAKTSAAPLTETVGIREASIGGVAECTKVVGAV